ncbi:MAG: hypothetical protein M5U31_16000 [Acidimicrobiia bacterium]|nr:hypothetical protein [Acidimicrobiia bacterium]
MPGVARIRTLVLHVGLHHTGGDFLTESLRVLRPQLHRHGVALLTDDDLAGLSHRDGWATRPDSAAEIATDFEGELRVVAGAALDAARRSATTPRTLLITSAELSGRRPPGLGDRDTFRPFAEPAIRQVVDALDPGRVQIVLHTRRQDRLMECCYVSEVQRGRHHSFPHQFPNRYEPVFSYVALVERLMALPRVRGVRVRPYETIGAGTVSFVDGFLGAVGLSGRLDLSDLATEHHESSLYSRNALRLALAMNPHLDTERERSLVRSFLLEEFPSPPYTEARFISKKSRARIIDAYRDDNEHLFSTHMPDLPRDSYASLEATRRLGSAAPAVPVSAQPFMQRARRAAARRLQRVRRHPDRRE